MHFLTSNECLNSTDLLLIDYSIRTKNHAIIFVMERISETINKIYLKYLPIVKRVGVTLDVDFPDTTLTIREKERVERDLDKTMESAVKRAKNNGRIVIQVRKGKIIIKDNGTILSKTTCDLLSTEHVKVESRLGFGTTVTIQAKHQD